MKDWREARIPRAATLREAFAAIERSGLQVALMVDGNGRLQGILTDGDIRRGLLSGLGLDDPSEAVLNRKPSTGAPGQGKVELHALMRARGLHHLPIVDSQGRLVGLEVAPHLLGGMARANAAVVMVGGLGTRLAAVLQDRPKPLIEVGAKPVLEGLIEGLVDSGIVEIFLAIHYRGEMIEEFCGDGSRWGARIQYLREDRPLGTAGALGLLDQTLSDPFLVMNGDLVTGVDFGRLLDYHSEHAAKLTVGLKEYDLEIPYGVVSTDGVHVSAIEEKPTRSFFVSAGIYVADPDVPSLIARGQRVDMPDLARRLVEDGHTVVGFPIAEYWIDIGQMEDLERARRDAQFYGSDAEDGD